METPKILTTEVIESTKAATPAPNPESIAPIEPATEEVVEVTEAFTVKAFEPATETATETDTPQPETPTKPETRQSASEIHLTTLFKGVFGAPYLRVGYRAGVDYTKEAVLNLLADPAIKTRADLRAAIKAI